MWTVDLMFLRMFLFFPTHFFRRLQTDIFETFPHDVALVEKEALLCWFPKSAPNKNGQKKPKFRPIWRLIATYYAPSLVMCQENRRSKTISPERFDWSSRNFARWRILGLRTRPEVKISNFWHGGRMNTLLSSIDSRCSNSVSELWAFMFVVHTSNCHAQNCTRLAIFRLGIDTLIADILVNVYYYKVSRKRSYGRGIPRSWTLCVCLNFVYIFYRFYASWLWWPPLGNPQRILHLPILHPLQPPCTHST